MKIFETDRLIIRELRKSDATDYFDMMGNPNVMCLIPRKPMTRSESNKHLANLIDSRSSLSTTKIYAIEVKKMGYLSVFVLISKMMRIKMR